MSYSAVNSIQTCGDTLSTMTPKPPSPTTTGRSRPNRLCFRRTLSCSAMGGSKLNVGSSTRSKNSHGVLSKQPAINVISEEAPNINDDANKLELNKVEKVKVAANEGRSVIKEPTIFQRSPKKSSESNYSLPVISITCEDQTVVCDNNPPSIEISVEPPSPSRRTKSVPGALLAEPCTRPRTGSAPSQLSSCNFLMVPESFRNGVEHISHLVDPNPCCHFCKEPSQQPIHEDCTRLTIVSGGLVRSRDGTNLSPSGQPYISLPSPNIQSAKPPPQSNHSQMMEDYNGSELPGPDTSQLARRGALVPPKMDEEDVTT